MLDNFLLKLFDKYAELLKLRFSIDFQEVSITMFVFPDMADSLYRLCQQMTTCQWPSTLLRSMRKLSKSAGSLRRSQLKNSRMYPPFLRGRLAHMYISFPCVLPFSQMYPLCCIDIRNFLNQFYFFSDDHFQHPNVIDETLKKVRIIN